MHLNPGAFVLALAKTRRNLNCQLQGDDAIRWVVNRGREGRLFGVNYNGVCLLIAYITEIIQQGIYDYDSQKFWSTP